MIPKPAGIYIHIPFCERKCTYCNFNTTDFHADLASRYVCAVEREVEYWGETLAARQNVEQVADGLITDGRIVVDSIYFGGGTPSIVEASQLARLIEACRRAFYVSLDAEITIEINPGTLCATKIDGWRGCGINRASVGAQSFIDRELMSLSRTHTADDSRRTVDLLRQSGFENVSLDLMAGLPGQTIGEWDFNLGEALRIRPEHLSLYLLEVKEGTQLYAQIRRDQVESPDDDLMASMYRMICDRTRQAGYRQYEISNFAFGFVPGNVETAGFQSKHNLKYWTGAAFYGVGCGAHSYDGCERWHNTFRTETYIDQVEKTGCGIAQRRGLTDRERAGEALFMGLRLTEGVSLDQFREHYCLDALGRFGDELPRLREAGLIEVTASHIALTERGRLLSNEVFVALI